MLDDLDRRLLRQWQSDPSLSPADLAERARCSLGQANRRLSKLTQAGVIKAIETELNWAALGYSVEVSLRITLDKSVPNALDVFIKAAREIPEVLEIQTFLGQVDVRLSVIARDMAHYQNIYRNHILMLPHMSDLEALMHVASIKRAEDLPL